jgi:hypothetical protein
MADRAAEAAAEEAAEQPYDANDPEQVNKARQRSGRKRKDRLRFVQAAMEHAEGRAWFYDLLTACHIYHTAFLPGQPDATAFRLGEQNIGNRILADIQACAGENYLVMLKEAKSG